MNRLLALLAVLAVEVACILHGLAPLAEIEAPPPPVPPVAPRVAASQRTPVSIEALLARPLFTPGRAPPQRDHAPAPVLATPPRLTGLVFAEQRGRAIFAGPDGRPIVLGKGGRLGPFTVVAVRPDGVELDGPPGVRLLRPSRGAGSPPADRRPVLALIDPERREAETESDQ